MSPDLNNNDAGVYPLMTRKVAAAGAESKEEIRKAVKGVWRGLVATELTNIDLRVQRNMEMIKNENGGNYYDESKTKGVVPYTLR